MNTSDVQAQKRRYGIVGNSEGLNHAVDIALQVAKTDLSVLITGESGVGKEIIPRIIHDNSLRKTMKYFAVNCGSIPEGTIDSELFGHEKVAFTGAIGEREGYFGAANGGTLFLDEVGNLTIEMQQMLLRAIQERRYRPVGAKGDKTANVRIVAATNENLHNAVKEKRFRQDLLHRLQEYVITIPPLRDCQEDIMPLADFFRELANDELGRNVRGFDASARKALLTHTWSGNVSELKQKILPNILHTESYQLNDTDLEKNYESASSSTVSFALRTAEEEKERIIRALKQANGNKILAARLLAISRSTLYAKIEEYGIKVEKTFK